MVSQWENTTETAYLDNKFALYLWVNYKRSMVKYGVTKNYLISRKPMPRADWELMDVRFGSKNDIENCEGILRTMYSCHEYVAAQTGITNFHKISNLFGLERIVVSWKEMLKQ